MKWVSEQDALPNVAQLVLLATPRQSGDFWDLRTVRLLIRHEGVLPRPVKIGSRWPTEYWWGAGGQNDFHVLVTGNSWWSALNDIGLPPGAQHATGPGGHYIAQPDYVWVGQNMPENEDSE